MTHKASFHLSCPADAARSAAAALAPESDDAPEGATVVCVPEEGGLRIDIEASDLSALRAACQGTVRLADAALRVASGRS